MRDFRKNVDGGMAILLAFAIPMLLAVAGGTLDFSMAVAARSDLAYVTKIACSRVATAGARGQVNADQIRLANATVNAHLPKTMLKMGQTNINVTPGSSGDLEARGTAIYDTTFMRIFGLNSIGVRWTETCAGDMRVPTDPPSNACTLDVPHYDPGTSEALSLRDARDEYVDFNQRRSPPVTVSAPDELIITVFRNSDNSIIERDLLSDDNQRGVRRVDYSRLPSGVTLTLQPITSAMIALPTACLPGSPPPPTPPTNPPPPPTNSGSCTPTANTLGSNVNTGGGSGGNINTGSSSSSGPASTGVNQSVNAANGSTGSNSAATSGPGGNATNTNFCATATNGTVTSNASSNNTYTSANGTTASASGSITGTASGSSVTQSGSMTTYAGPASGAPTLWLP
jgi:Flp pilus assembly protein TadG